MSHDPDRDARLTEFLRERAGPLPQGLLEHVDATVRSTAQDRVTVDGLPSGRRTKSWVPLAAAAVLLVAIGYAAARWSDLGPLLGLVGSSNGPRATPTLPAEPTTPSEPPASTPLLGLWSASDIDGSQMTVTVVVQDDALIVTYKDLRATVCSGGVQTAVATAPMSTVQIVASGLSGCEDTTPADHFEGTWTYSRPDETLSQVGPGIDGNVTIVWRRGPGAPDAFDDDWTSGTGPTRRTLTLEGGIDGVDATYAAPGIAGCDGETFTASGLGAIGTVMGEGRYITLTLSGGCSGASEPLVWKFEYLAETDALSGPLGLDGEPLDEMVTWER